LFLKLFCKALFETPYIIGDMGLKKPHDPIRRRVLYNILVAFGITIKIGDIIKMC
jgi:hypothetical protein